MYKKVGGIDVKASLSNLAQVMRCLARHFVHWQICSLLLAVAFIPYTYFFWTIVVKFQDSRYVASAITMHMLWGVIWVIISMPLLYTWYKVQIFRLERRLISASKGADAEKESELEEFMPIGYLNILGSLLTGMVAFLAPILKSFI